jgi:XTP/dITP diphosphohydrolase
VVRKFDQNTLVIATHNRGKLIEFQHFLGDCIPLIQSAADFQLDAPEETGRSFRENAMIKARHVSEETGKVSLADDSGLIIPLLGGQPGVHSADWIRTEKGIEGAFERIKEGLMHVEAVNKVVAASFHVALCLYWPDGVHEFVEASCSGHISFPPRGKNGHGYDPIFVPQGYQKTFAELSVDEKEKLSHRGKALRALKKAFFE